jgi:hypothetical protein
MVLGKTPDMGHLAARAVWGGSLIALTTVIRRQGRHLVDTLVAEPPAKPWHDLLAPLLVSTALVGIALLLSLVQMLFDA